MRLTYWTYLIGTLALAGIFPLSGFWSKDEILADAWLAGIVERDIGGYIAFGVLLLAAGLVGRLFVDYSERVLNRMPVVRSIYGATKQIFETMLMQKSGVFREVVLVEFPRTGMWSIGFIAGRTEGEIQELTEDEVLNVYIPTTPNPTSGYLCFVPRKDIFPLTMSVEEGIKMVVSGGIVTPPDRRPLSERKTKIHSQRST